MLSIFVLSSSNSTGSGELLRQLHEQLARDLPENFTDVLAETAAVSTLSKDRSYGRFIINLQSKASAKSITNPVKLLRKLGSVVERGGQAVPIHDLYWSWLAGRDLITHAPSDAAIEDLQTRDSYRLAAQSGSQSRASDIAAVIDQDIILAAILDASISLDHVDQTFVTRVNQLLGDDNLSVRNRAGLAALESGKSILLKGALDTLSALSTAKLHVPEWREAIRPKRLFPQRAILAEWIGSEGSEFVLDAIAEQGGPEWMPWLEQLAVTGKITKLEALYTTLGCTTCIPAWGLSHLNELFKNNHWKLRAVAVRRTNLALAHYIAFHYEHIVENVVERNSGAWVNLNRVLVGCGDDSIFNMMLSKFHIMSNHTQDLVSYAFVERGQPWIEAIQCVAFAEPRRRPNHNLKEVVSPGISDATAREWISAGHYEEGWHVLIANHGEAVVPELVAELPLSFAGLDHIPALAVMRFLKQAPEFLPNELLRRLGSPMQPKTMQDLFRAMATTYPGGVASIVNFVSQQHGSMPAFFLLEATRLYKPWRERFGGELMVMTVGEEPDTFPRWIARQSALLNWENHFTAEILSTSPELAAELILTRFKDDHEKTEEILKLLKGLKGYREDLLQHMLSVPNFAEYIPAVFDGCFDTFPVTALQACLDSPHIKLELLLWRLSTTNNPMHKPFHSELIKTLLNQPLDLHQYRYLANMLRVHSVDDICDLLRENKLEDKSRWLWLVREVEAARRERLVDEAGELRNSR